MSDRCGLLGGCGGGEGIDTAYYSSFYYWLSYSVIATPGNSLTQQKAPLALPAGSFLLWIIPLNIL